MIYKYLLEIKYRIFFSFTTWCCVMINCYYFKETLVYIFMKFSLETNTNNLLYFLTTDVAEIFLAYIQLSYYTANQVTITYLYWQFFLFLSPGLYNFESDYLKTIITISILSRILCMFVLNSFIFPISWNFFSKFQEYLSFQNLTFYFEVKLSEYLIFYTTVYHLCNSIFQVGVLFFLFVDLFRTNLYLIKKLRKIFYFFFFVFATFLSPPEVLYQLAISICLIISYELIVLYMIIKTELCNLR